MLLFQGGVGSHAARGIDRQSGGARPWHGDVAFGGDAKTGRQKQQIQPEGISPAGFLEHNG